MCYLGHYPETHLAAFESFYFIFSLPNAACLTTIFAAAEELPEWVSHYNNFKDQKQPDGSFRLLRQIRYTIWGLSSLYIPFYRQTWNKLIYHSVLARRYLSGQHNTSKIWKFQCSSAIATWLSDTLQPGNYMSIHH